MDDKAGLKRPLESPVPREEIEEDVSSIERHRSLDQNDLSDVADNSKVEKNRERNREHAKRTRQRKKEMMEGMKIRLLELQREAGRLEQLLEESNTASILLCLGTKPGSNNGEPPSIPNPESAEDLQAKLQVSRGNIIDHLRQRVRIEAAQNVKDKADAAVDEDEEGLEDKDSDNGEFDDETKNLESFSTSWKAGQQVEALQDPVSGKSFSSDDIKRERNRMHAKLTRDRKKLFTSRMQQTIQALERHNQMLRNKLQAMAPGSSGSTSNSAISTMESSTPSDSTGVTTSMSSSSGSMNGSANNSGGTTPAASSSSRLQGSVASGTTTAGISVPANSFGDLPSGVIPVFPVKTGPNGVVSWMPTAALAWAAVAPPSGNSPNNPATPTLYPIVTTVDGALTGLPPISASLAQSFYQFQRNYFNAQNGNPTGSGDSGDTSDGNRSNSNLASAKDHP